MAAYFFDTSALAKRYIRETGTAWVIGLFRPFAGNRIYVAEITLVEVISALTRRQRGLSLSAGSAAKSSARFRRAFSDKLRRIAIDLQLLEKAAQLAEKHGLRGYDAVQLAAARQVHQLRQRAGASPLTLVSADNALNAAAQAEGLLVDNPNLHP